MDEDSLRSDIHQTLADVDEEISTWRDDSDLQRFNHNHTTGWQTLPADVIALMVIAKTVYEQSDHCFDPTVKPLFALWGFQEDKLHIPDDADIDRTLASIGFDKIELDPAHDRLRKIDPDLSVDLSAMGEGYTIRRLAAVLENHRIDNFLLEFGGDVLVKGHKPDGRKWRIGIERPTPGPPGVEKVVVINDENGVSLNTSGTYHHFFTYRGKLYPHILDPRTGRPVTHHLVSASVFGTDPRVSDAWATAMICLGKAAGEPIAEKQKLPVLYVQETTDGKLATSMSRPLQHSNAVSILR